MGLFFFKENTYTLLPVGYKGLYGIGHLTTILFSKSLQLINRIRRGLPKNSDDLLDPVIVAATSVFFLLPVPGPVTEIQKEISQMACLISKTTNTTAKVLAQINQR